MTVSNKTIGLNIMGLLIIKAISMAISLATIPALLAYFHNDKEILGTWLAFLTFTTIAASLDLGIGNRLKNDALTRIAQKLDYVDLIKESFNAQISVSLFVGTLALGSGLAILTTQTSSSETARIIQGHPDLVAFAAAFIIVSMPLRLSYFVLQAQQKNAISALIALAPQAALLLYAMGAQKASALPTTLNALASILLIATVAAYFLPFLLAKRLKKPNRHFFTKRINLGLSIKNQINKLKPGLSFFFMQISIIFLYSNNELFYLVSGTATDIVQYQYYFRPFSLFSVGFSIISLPFWSAIRLSQLSNDAKRTRQLFITIISLIAPAAIILAPTVYFYQDFLDIWLGNGTHTASSFMLVVFSITSLLTCIMHALSSILSGFDLIKFQAKVLGAGLLIKLTAFAIMIFFDSTPDPVMTSTTIGLAFITTIYASKAIGLWRLNSTDRKAVL